ncbi:MAG TPA: calcium-binding protein [Solirubrobacteraceae bacterium]
MADRASGDRRAGFTSAAIEGQQEGSAAAPGTLADETKKNTIGIRARRAVATTATVLLGVPLVPAVAHAAVAGSAQASFPSNGSSVTVGQTGLLATLTLTNLNSGADASATNEICNVGESSPPCVSPERGITLVPSCKLLTGLQCTATGADPGVFALSATGTGVIGSSCGGMPFTITVIDPSLGTVRFTPSPGSRVTLAGSGSACTIRFTFDVLRSPAADQDPATPGNQTAQAMAHTQFKVPFGPMAPSSFTRNTSTGTTVLRAGPPSIATVASGDIYLDGQLTDQATVSSLVNAVPGATVTFRLYPPSSPTCTGTPVFVSSQPMALAGTTATATSGAFTPLAIGVYHWIATYDGDANNLPSSGTCAEASETVAVHEAPTLTTSASPYIVVGTGTLSDSATVSGTLDPQPGATITFSLFGPDDATCTGTPVFSPAPAPYPATGGPVTSPAFAPPTAGTYRWIASYSGDANNPSATGLCGDAQETTVVARAAPSLTTNASSDIVLGSALLFDAAALSGRFGPTASATIEFRLYGPGDTTCAGPPVFESSNVPYPIGGGFVPSASFTPTQAGTYRWIAAYSGDTNNLPITGSCDGVDERTVVARATPTIATTASPDITVGAGRLTDAAVVTGRVNQQPTATIDFRLYGPGDATCSGTPAFESPNIVYAAAGGSVTSAPFAPTQAGTYRWRAFYSGDANNAPVSGACNDAAESAVAKPAAPAPARPACLGKTATIVPAAGTTVIVGTPGRDVIVGGDAGETIYGRGGDDTICAGRGNDRVRGGAGNDRIRGADGNDRLFGNGGHDRLQGDGGNDDLRGGSGKDRTGGGNGRDRVDGGSGNDLLDEQKLGGKGRDRLAGGAGADRVRSADGSTDSVDCGPGRDSASMDRLDRQKRCETIRRLKAPA